MKLSSVIVSVSTSLVFACVTRAADSGAAFDTTQRNPEFAPSATVRPETSHPQTQRILADLPVEKAMVRPGHSAPGERRAAIEIVETNDKAMHEKNIVVVPVQPKVSAGFDHRRAPFSTADRAGVPARVAKYQDGLTAATVANMARFPDLRAPSIAAKINRFVFRKNPPDTAALSPPGNPGNAIQPEPAARR